MAVEVTGPETDPRLDPIVQEREHWRSRHGTALGDGGAEKVNGVVERAICPPQPGPLLIFGVKLASFVGVVHRIVVVDLLHTGVFTSMLMDFLSSFKWLACEAVQVGRLARA